MRTYRFALALAGSAVLWAAPATAHHSFAMYDQTRPVVLKGVVDHVQWTNPHVLVFFRGAPATGGAQQDWVLELTSPGNLKRIGWARTSLPISQPLELTINPLRDGHRGGALRKAVLANGIVLTADWLRPGG
jgi:hypothetical protein